MIDPRYCEDEARFVIKFKTSKSAEWFRNEFEVAQHFNANAKAGKKVEELPSVRDVGEESKRLEFMEDQLLSYIVDDLKLTLGASV